MYKKVITYKDTRFRLLLIDWGNCSSNSNKWLDFRVFGLGFDWDSNVRLRFKHDFKRL